MNTHLPALGTAAAVLVVAGDMIRRAVMPRRPKGRHRTGPRFVPFEELFGPWSEYTAFDHEPRPIAHRFADCQPCDRTTVGVAHRDGSWTCGECLTTTEVAS